MCKRSPPMEVLLRLRMLLREEACGVGVGLTLLGQDILGQGWHFLGVVRNELNLFRAGAVRDKPQEELGAAVHVAEIDPDRTKGKASPIPLADLERRLVGY